VRVSPFQAAALGSAAEAAHALVASPSLPPGEAAAGAHPAPLGLSSPVLLPALEGESTGEGSFCLHCLWEPRARPRGARGMPARGREQGGVGREEGGRGKGGGRGLCSL